MERIDGEITLINLGSGAAVEKFQEELDKVVENITDPNTDAKVKREILLKVSITPDADRTWSVVQVQAQAKLAPNSAFSTRAYVGVDKQSGRSVACEDNPNQITIDHFIKDKPENVETIEVAKKAEEA